MHTSVQQRVVIKFLSREDVKSAEILRRLTAQFDETTLSTIKSTNGTKTFPMAESRCKIRPVHADKHQRDEYSYDA